MKGSRDLPALLLALLVTAPLLARLPKGTAPMSRDTTAIHHPFRAEVARAFGEGELPLWTRGCFCGYPLLANPLSAALYPANWLFSTVRFVTGLKITLVLHVALAAVGMFGFAMFWGLRPLSAVLAACAFALGGWMTTRLDSLPELCTSAWLPLTVLLLLRAMAAPRPGAVVLAGIALACQFLAGNPNTHINAVAAAAFFAAGFVAWQCVQERSLRPVATGLAVWVAAGALGLMLGAAQALPTLELTANSPRGAGIPLAMAAQWAIFPGHLLTWLMPFAFGAPGYDRYWGGALPEFAHGAYYVGTVGIGLAVVGTAWLLIARRDNGRTRAGAAAAVALALTAILLALGQHTPFYGLCVRAMPVLGFFHSPYKFMFLGSFAVALLAGIGMDALIRSVWAPRGEWLSRRARVLLVAGWVAAGCLWVDMIRPDGLLPHRFERAVMSLCVPRAMPQFLALQRSAAERHLARLLRFDASRLMAILSCCAIAALWASRRPGLRRGLPLLLLALHAGELCCLHGRVFRTGPADLYDGNAPLLASLRGRILVPDSTEKQNWMLYGIDRPAPFRWAKRIGLSNRGMAAGASAAHGEGPLNLARHKRVLRLAQDWSVPQALRLRMLAALGVRHRLTHRAMRTPMDVSEPAEQHIRVAELPDPAASAVHVSRVRVVSTAEQAYAALADAPTVAVLEDDAPPKTLAASERGLGKATPLTTSVRRHVLRVRGLPPLPGAVVIHEPYYPGWRCWQAHKRRNVHPADYAWRGVWTDGSAGALLCAFEPQSFKLGAGLSLLGLGIVAVSGLLCAWRRG